MPLSEPMTTNCELDPEQHITMNAFFLIQQLHSRNNDRKYHIQNGGHFVSVSMGLIDSGQGVLLQPIPGNDAHLHVLILTGSVMNNMASIFQTAWRQTFHGNMIICDVCR